MGRLFGVFVPWRRKRLALVVALALLAGVTGLPGISLMASRVGPPPCTFYAYEGLKGDPQLSVRWIAEGDQILFIHGTAIYEVAADGSELRTVVDTSDSAFTDSSSSILMRATSLDVSADGLRVLYAMCRHNSLDGGELYEIGLVDRASGEVKRLGIGQAPVWSPDGQQIALVSTRFRGVGNSPRLYTIGADGREWRRIAGSTELPIRRPPAWSPDGHRLAFVGDEEKIGLQPWLYTVDADGTQLQRLTETLSEPSWSPDGEQIAFAKRDGNQVALYTIAGDGTGARLVTAIRKWSPDSHLRGSWVKTVAWSPVGGQILYTCGEQVCVVGVDGGAIGRSPVMFEDGAVVGWSPDGERIAIASGGQPDEDGVLLYTMAPDGTRRQVLVRAGAGPVAENSGYADLEGSIEACREGFVVTDPESNPGLVRDCETLLGLRDTLLGGDAVNWGAGTPIGEWWGVSIGGTPRRVTGLTLDGEDPAYIGTKPDTITARLAGLTQLEVLKLTHIGLAGPIPPEFGNLTELKTLDLSHNRLFAPIPPELGNLNNLLILDLSHNSLSGAIPPELGNLTSLLVLDLSGSRFSGTIPPELGNLAKLRVLDISGVGMGGAIPAELGKLANLRTLDLRDNVLNGVIPPELGALSSLQELYLVGNRLDGAIPEEIGQLAGHRLTDLYVGYNRLTGCIPVALLVLRRDDLMGLRLPFCYRQDDESSGWFEGVTAAVGQSGWWALLVLPLAATAVVVVRLARRRRSRG